MISKSTRCSAKPSSSPEDSEPTSGSQMVQGVRVTQLRQEETSPTMMMTTFIVKLSQYLFFV